MIQISQTWNGQAAYATVQAASWEAIQRMVHYYHMKLQEAVSISAGRKIGTIFRWIDGKVRPIELRENPSKPGKPPHLRTGWLRKNILFDLDKAKLQGRVGVTRNARYGLYLELGTRRMLPRPWLIATLKKFLPQLKALAQVT